MSKNPFERCLLRTFMLACALFTLLSASAYAAELHPQIGRLPGYPAIRGMVPVLGSKAAISSHEKLVSEAFAQVRARHTSRTGAPTTEPNENLISECEEEALFFETQDVCYRGGPVLHHVTVHLIFWQGPATVGVEPFSSHYREIIEGYFENVAHDSGLQTNVFAIDQQYGEENSKHEFVSGEYSIAFNRVTDVTVDEVTAFPTTHVPTECVDKTEYSKGPCLFDSDIHEEVTRVAKEKSWPTENLENVYLVLTPQGVGGCFGFGSNEGCAYKQYCAYHGDFGGNGVTPGNQTIYADLPYLGEVPGCDFGVHPNEAVSEQEEEKGEDHGADAVIDTASHELNEAITDPLGSQCETGATKASQCERNAWTDAIGQEVGDKCLPPESTLDGTYGEPLGELIPGRPASSYNQLIDGGHYWTQRMWSNEAGVLEGGCVQRMIGAQFSISANPAATVPITFDGSASGAPGDPAVYWVWNFGEGEQVGTASPTTTHTYPKGSEHLVTLTAYDAYGNARATFQIVTVGPAPPTPVFPLAPAPAVKEVLKEVKIPVAHYSSAQIATLLGLPASGAKLRGSSITLGHATCPPACSVSATLYATVTSKHRHQRVLVGKLANSTVTSAKQPIVLSINGNGRRLLRVHHRFLVMLKLAVVGQEGASWSINRPLILTG